MKDLLAAIVREGNKKIFSTWLFAGLLLLSSGLFFLFKQKFEVKYTALRTEYDEYKEKTDGYERFVYYQKNF